MGGQNLKIFRPPSAADQNRRLLYVVCTYFSTGPGDILDTIECFSVVRNTLLSLATPNRKCFMFFTQIYLVNDSNIYIYFTHGAGKILVVLVLCLSTGRI